MSQVPLTPMASYYPAASAGTFLGPAVSGATLPVSAIPTPGPAGSQRTGGGSFFAFASPTLKDRAKKRVSTSQYLIFNQISNFIIDPYWRTQFSSLAGNSPPPNFSIRQNYLHCRRNNKPFKIQLVYGGINDMAGLNGLNHNILQILQQTFVAEAALAPAATPARWGLESTPARWGLESTPARWTVEATPQRAEAMLTAAVVQDAPVEWWNPANISLAARLYISPFVLQQLCPEISLLINYILQIIAFLQEHGSCWSPADQQRQREKQVLRLAAPVTWAEMEKEVRQAKFEEYIGRLAVKLNLQSWDAERFKTHMRTYYYLNGIPADAVVLSGLDIAEIRGLDFSNGQLPALKSVKAHTSAKEVTDLALKDWRKYVSTYWAGGPV